MRMTRLVALAALATLLGAAPAVASPARGDLFTRSGRRALAAVVRGRPGQGGARRRARHARLSHRRRLVSGHPGAAAPQPAGHRRPRRPEAQARLSALHAGSGRPARARGGRTHRRRDRRGDLPARGPRGERYLGFGERSNAVDQRGNEVENYVAEGPFEADERPLIAPFSRRPGAFTRGRTRPTSRCPGCCRARATACCSTTRSAACSAWAASGTTAGAPRWTRPASSCACSPGPGPPACCVGSPGPWASSRGPRARRRSAPGTQPRDDERTILARLQRDDVPLSLAQTYTHYLPCADQAGREAAERERVRAFHERGLAVTTYFNPMICTEHPVYAEAASRGCSPARAPAAPTRTATARWRASTLASSTSATLRAGGCTAASWPRRAPTATTAGWRISASTPRSTPASPTAATAS